MLSKLFSSFRPKQKGLHRFLGETEAEIMEIIWRMEGASVRDVHEELLLSREIAYTTVMTIMARLADKKLLVKEKVGSAYFYTPICSEDEFTKTLIGEVIDGLLEDYSDQAFAHFLGRIKKDDEEKLAQLEDILKAKSEEEA